MPTSDTETILENVELSDDMGVVNNAFVASGDYDTSANSSSTDPKRVRKIWKWNLEGMTLVVLSVIVVSFAITVALVINIILGSSEISPHAMVVSENTFCGSCGLDLLHRKSANAVDGAVATALCIAVTRPDKASLAGCGLALVRDRKLRENQLFDFMCPAPSNPSVVDSAKPETTVGVPGFVRGLYTIHRKYGKLPWSDLFICATKAASDGFQPDPALLSAAKTAAQHSPTLASSPIVSSLNGFTDGVYRPLSNLKQTLDLLAANGAEYFYQMNSGRPNFANQLLNHFTGVGHAFSAASLSNYLVEQPKPIEMGFAGFIVETFPAPSSVGPYLLSILGNLDLKNALAPLNDKALAINEANATGTMLHRLLELARVAESSVTKLGDPYDETIGARVLKNQADLFAPGLRKPMVSAINDMLTGTSPLPTARRYVDIGDTGILVSDSDHLTVVVNLYMGTPFGAGTVIPNTGVHLNAALRLFADPKQASNTLNLLAPGRRPLVPLSPVHVSATHRKCGVRVGVVNSGGFWGALDTAQVIVNAALFLRGTTCHTPVGMPSGLVNDGQAKKPRRLHQSSYSPAADFGCINAQGAIDLPRMHIRRPSAAVNTTTVEIESNTEEALRFVLSNHGHEVAYYPDAWPGRVAMGGWNGYNMITSVDRRGAWSLKFF